MSLPSGYTKLGYIESSGTQYIDTGVTIDSTNYNKLKFILDNQYLSFGGSYWLVNGCSGNGVVYYFGVATGGAIYYGDGTTDIPTGITASIGHQIIEFDTSNGNFKFGNKLSLSGITFNAPTGSSNFHLFGYNKGSSTDCHNERIYACKIYNESTLVRDFVPAKRNIDEVVGLYDLVNDVFYTNSGTGSFNFPIKLPSNYTQIQYIESNGTQCIDTGYKQNQNTRVIMEATLFSHRGSACLFGNILSSSPNIFCGIYNDGVRPDEWYPIMYASSSASTRYYPLYGERLIIDFSYKYSYINGTQWTNSTSKTYQYSLNLYLLASNNSDGTTNKYANARIYSCQIYDDGVCIRNFIPAKRNSDSIVGLYDTVNGVFYINAGTGVFTYEDLLPKHKTLISNTSYEIKRGYGMINGTSYDTKYGIIMKDGTIYNIIFGKTHTVTVSGSSTHKYSKATINGDILYEIGEYQFESNGELSINIILSCTSGGSYSTRYCKVKLNGTVVHTGVGTYTFSTNSEIINIEIGETSYETTDELAYYGYANITTE